MKQTLVIFTFLTALLLVGSDVYGQLITDSDRRLRTEKKEKEGGLFGLFKKKNKSSSDRPLQKQSLASRPRYSSGSPFASFNKRKAASPRTSSADRSSIFKNYRFQGPRSVSGANAFSKAGKNANVRYSPKSPFSKKDKTFAPRSSSGSPFLTENKRRRVLQPRFSPGSPFTEKDRVVSPRFSPPKRSSKIARLQPRYSPGSPFSKKERTIAPRYSPESPFRGKDKTFAPRYSPGSPFTAKEKTVEPRYSPASPSRGKDKKFAPRYSPGSPFTAKEKTVAPRYSPSKPFSDKEKEVNPKYSPGSPFASMRWGWIKPRYSTNKHRFEVDEKLRQQSRPGNMVESNYKGDYKKSRKWHYALVENIDSWKTSHFKGDVKYESHKPKPPSGMDGIVGDYKIKYIRHKQMHPSAPYRKANYDSELFRDGARKWNLLLTRVSRNKDQPNAVKDKISKPKFDRKEAQIWNE